MSKVELVLVNPNELYWSDKMITKNILLIHFIWSYKCPNYCQYRASYERIKRKSDRSPLMVMAGWQYLRA